MNLIDYFKTNFITAAIVFCAILCTLHARIQIFLPCVEWYHYSAFIIISIALRQQQKQKLSVFFACVGAITMITSYRIHSIKKNYEKCAQYVSKPVIIKGEVIACQESTLDRQTRTLLLKPLSIYNKDLGLVQTSMYINIQMPLKRGHNIVIGDEIHIYNILLTQAEANSDYRNYLLRNNIGATSFITNEKIFITKHSKLSYLQSLYKKINLFINRKTRLIFMPLFLGKKEKSKEYRLLQKQSLYWGIAHHMARSGVHLIMVLMLLTTLLTFLQIRYKQKATCLTIAATLYQLISFDSLSFIRSLSMLHQKTICYVIERQYSSIHALGVTTIATIFYNPYCVLFLDFQLSFGITAAIIWLFKAKYAKNIANLTAASLPC